MARFMFNNFMRQLRQPCQMMTRVARRMMERLLMVAATLRDKDPEIPKLILPLLFFFYTYMMVYLIKGVADCFWISEPSSEPVRLWNAFYYLCNKAEHFMLWFSLFVVCQSLRRVLLPVVLYSSIRFLWQIVTTLIKMDQNPEWWVNLMWLILVGYLTYQSIRQLLKNRKEK